MKQWADVLSFLREIFGLLENIGYVFCYDCNVISSRAWRYQGARTWEVNGNGWGQSALLIISTCSQEKEKIATEERKSSEEAVCTRVDGGSYFMPRRRHLWGQAEGPRTGGREWWLRREGDQGWTHTASGLGKEKKHFLCCCLINL